MITQLTTNFGRIPDISSLSAGSTTAEQFRLDMKAWNTELKKFDAQLKNFITEINSQKYIVPSKDLFSNFIIGNDDMTLKERIEALEANFAMLKNFSSSM